MWISTVTIWSMRLMEENGFNMKANGDCLIIRANPVKDKMVAFKMVKGYRPGVQWLRNIPMRSRKWYMLKSFIKGKRAEHYLNNKRYVIFKFKKKIRGKISLWSNSDSYVFSDDFSLQHKYKG